MKLYPFGIEVKELKLHCQRGKEKRRNKDFWGVSIRILGIIGGRDMFVSLSTSFICVLAYYNSLFFFSSFRLSFNSSFLCLSTGL
jgi:hypothetical protein